MPVSGPKPIKFDATELGRRVAAEYQARCDERDEALAEAERLRETGSGRDYTGEFMRGARPWWRLWLRHPIRETKWWCRYGR